FFEGQDILGPIKVLKPDDEHPCAWAECEFGAVAWNGDYKGPPSFTYKPLSSFACSGDRTWRYTGPEAEQSQLQAVACVIKGCEELDSRRHEDCDSKFACYWPDFVDGDADDWKKMTCDDPHALRRSDDATEIAPTCKMGQWSADGNNIESATEVICITCLDVETEREDVVQPTVTGRNKEVSCPKLGKLTIEYEYNGEKQSIPVTSLKCSSEFSWKATGGPFPPFPSFEEAVRELPTWKARCIIPEDNRCRSGFLYYEGWCVYSTGHNEYSFQDAANVCNGVGALAPSIHNKYELDFWSEASEYVTSGHYWLDASCPTVGQPYVWKDETQTDYMGPRGELQQCDGEGSYHIHPFGFDYYKYDVPAPAICVYKFDAPPDPQPVDPTANYCSCEPSKTYLDIVFIVDTSEDMNSNTVGDAIATIRSTLSPMQFGKALFQSQVAILAYGDKVQTVKNFGDIRNTNDVWEISLPSIGGKATKLADAIKQVSSMISNNKREITRGVIVLLSKSFNQLDAINIKGAAEAFKDTGGIIITIDYANGGIAGLKDIATTGYYINEPATNPDNLNSALCDANCFCPDGLLPYNVPKKPLAREVPMGCYHVAKVPSVYDAAALNCKKQKGYVATMKDYAKNIFMVSLFPEKARFWIGMKENNEKRYEGPFEWSDGSDIFTTFWAPANPVFDQHCVYAQQQSGSNSAWFSADCTEPLKYSMTYACQFRPCDSKYDCRM
ncbi:hypothetical protein PENTCL1PPCAC_28197, partial [Pristionchus entomophagus]